MAIAGSCHPIDFISSIVVTAKVIIHRLWEVEIPCNGEIPEKMGTIWNDFCTQLCILRNMPQYISFGMPQEQSTEQVLTGLITSKSRVTPVKRISIPRLELWAALLLTSLYSKVGPENYYSKSNIFIVRLNYSIMLA